MKSKNWWKFNLFSPTQSVIDLSNVKMDGLLFMENLKYFKDVINQIPLGLKINLVSNHEEILSKLQNLDLLKENNIYCFFLTKSSKAIFNNLEPSNDIFDFIEKVEIYNETKLIFEGYNGMEFGCFSKYFKLPRAFVEEYKDKDLYTTSDTW